LPVVEPKRVMFSSEPVNVRSVSPRAPQQPPAVQQPLVVQESLPQITVAETTQVTNPIQYVTQPITVDLPQSETTTSVASFSMPQPIPDVAPPVVTQYSISEVLRPTTVTLPAPTVTLPTIRVTETPLPPVPQMQTMTVTASQGANGVPEIDINLATVPVPPAPIPIPIPIPEPIPTAIPLPRDVVVTTVPDCRINDKQSVDNLLRTYLYTPLAKITVKTENGKSCEYIKALNPLGIIVFVQLNDGGYVTIEKSDLTMVKSATTDMVPYSLKRSTYDMVSPHSSGVAIECSKGVCVVERSATGVQAETNYFYTEPEQGTATILQRPAQAYFVDDAMIAHPIVSLRDIKANAVLTLQYTELSNNKLIEKERQDCDMILRNFNDVHVRFVEKAKFFYLGHRDITSTLLAKKCEHELIVRELVINQTRCDADRIKYKVHLDDLMRREQLQTDMIKFCRVIAGMSNKLSEMNADFDVMNAALTRDFRGVGDILTIPR
jgi:hypothetical protein